MLNEYEVAHAVAGGAGHRGDFDIRVDPAGAARSSQVVAGDARLPVENRAEPVAAVASAGHSSPRLAQTARVRSLTFVSDRRPTMARLRDGGRRGSTARCVTARSVGAICPSDGRRQLTVG